MRPKKFNKHDILKIEWEDIVQDSSWKNMEELNKTTTAIIISVGFFLENKKRTLKIAHHISLNDNESDITVIPWSVVRKIKVIEE